MNSKTGRIYRVQEEIDAAKLRGEPLVGVSSEVADAQEIGQAFVAGGQRARRKRKPMTHKERAAAMQAARKAGRSHSGKKRIRRVGIR